MWVGSSVENDHMIKWILRVFVTKLAVVPAECCIMGYSKFPCERLVPLYQLFEDPSSMLDDPTSCGIGFWKVHWQARVSFYVSKNITWPGQHCKVIVLQVGILPNYWFRNYFMAKILTRTLTTIKQQALRLSIQGILISDPDLLNPFMLPSVGPQWSLRCKEQ